jgi:hypothetical protein
MPASRSKPTAKVHRLHAQEDLDAVGSQPTSTDHDRGNRGLQRRRVKAGWNVNPHLAGGQ